MNGEDDNYLLSKEDKPKPHSNADISRDYVELKDQIEPENNKTTGLNDSSS